MSAVYTTHQRKRTGQCSALSPYDVLLCVCVCVSQCVGTKLLPYPQRRPASPPKQAEPGPDTVLVVKPHVDRSPNRSSLGMFSAGLGLAAYFFAVEPDFDCPSKVMRETAPGKRKERVQGMIRVRQTYDVDSTLNIAIQACGIAVFAITPLHSRRDPFRSREKTTDDPRHG